MGKGDAISESKLVGESLETSNASTHQQEGLIMAKGKKIISLEVYWLTPLVLFVCMISFEDHSDSFFAFGCYVVGLFTEIYDS